MLGDGVGKNFENDLFKDIIPYIQSHYSTQTDAQHRALAGLSLGGMQTRSIAPANSDKFSYFGVFILNPTAKIVSGFKPVMPTFQGIVSDEQLNALVAYVKSLAQPAPGTAGLQNQPAASPAQPQKMQVQ